MQSVDETDLAVGAYRAENAIRTSAAFPSRIVALFGFTVFCSAFLLFQVQLVIAKYILPWFGGTPAIFTTCILFFQILLFLGYSYAHFIDVRLSPRSQALVHSVLIIVALALLHSGCTHGGHRFCQVHLGSRLIASALCSTSLACCPPALGYHTSWSRRRVHCCRRGLLVFAVIRLTASMRSQMQVP